MAKWIDLGPNSDVVTPEEADAKISEGMAEPITYSEMAARIGNSLLVPGRKYRITDYVATTNGDMSSQSANKPFDIIVTALTNNTLSEEAGAIQHAGDTYFDSSKLSAWKVWYCFANDSDRFAWADTTNGKGVIYRLIDEFGNDVPYDFKGIMFNPYDPDGNYSTYYFTFDSNSGIDYSKDGSKCVYRNKIRPYYTNNKFKLNKIVFRGDYCYSNSFGNDCHSNTFGNDCYYNTFGNDCNYNIFGTNCYSNSFGDYCHSNTFGNYCHSNTFGDQYSYSDSGVCTYTNRAASYPMLAATYGDVTYVLPESAFPIALDGGAEYTFDNYQKREIWIEWLVSDLQYVLYIEGDIAARWSHEGLFVVSYSVSSFNGSATINLVQAKTTTLTPWAVNSSVDEGFGAYQIDVGFATEAGIRARDLVWTFDCSDSATAPEVVWDGKFFAANEDEHNLCVEDGKVNVFFITEVFNGRFIVSRQLLPASALGSS